MQPIGRPRRLLALLMAACVVLAEVQSSSAEADEPTQGTAVKRTTTKKAAPKIRRTIRMVEPPSQPAASPASGPQNFELKNEGPLNQVEVRPNISIVAPAAAVAAAVAERDQAGDTDEPAGGRAPLQSVPIAAPASLVRSGAEPASSMNHVASLDGSSNELLQLSESSGNQLTSAATNSGNTLSKSLTNSGNTEHVHIDGVGNNKVAHISNVANTEERRLIGDAPGRLVDRPAPEERLARLGLSAGPLVSISVNNDRAPAGYLAPSQFEAGWQPPVQMLAAPPAQLVQAPAFAAPQAAGPYAMLPQMVFQAAPQMLLQPAPMIMMGAMLGPRDWGHLMRERRFRRVPKQKNKPRRRRAKRHDRNGKTKGVEVVEVALEPEPQKKPLPAEEKPQEPAKLLRLVEPERKVEPAPIAKAVQLKVEPVTVPPKDEPDKEEAEDDDEEEVIEWETVKVPRTRKRKVLKPKRAPDVK